MAGWRRCRGFRGRVVSFSHQSASFFLEAFLTVRLSVLHPHLGRLEAVATLRLRPPMSPRLCCGLSLWVGGTGWADGTYRPVISGGFLVRVPPFLPPARAPWACIRCGGALSVSLLAGAAFWAGVRVRSGRVLRSRLLVGLLSFIFRFSLCCSWLLAGPGVTFYPEKKKKK